jgi:hypothetical protein
MAEDRKSKHANHLHNLVDSLCEHQETLTSPTRGNQE